MRTLRDLLSAVRLLTVIPLGGAEGSRPARFFSWVGLLFGAISVGIVRLVGMAGEGSSPRMLLAGALVVGLSAVLSGAMHLDGLADTADALGVRGDAQRRLAVMRDSTVGAFGVIAVVLVVIIQVAAISVVVERGALWALLTAPVVARLAATVLLSLAPPARPDGLGARYATRDTVVGHLVAVMPVVVLALLLQKGALVIAAALVGVVISWMIARAARRLLGGVTGDVIGATIVLTEAALLLATALLPSAYGP